MPKISIKAKPLEETVAIDNAVVPENDDDEIEISKNVVAPVVVNEPVKRVRVRVAKEVDNRKRGNHERSQAQKDAFAKICEKRQENRDIRSNQRILDADADKKIVEEKIVKKAISIKKKSIVKSRIIDEISDDDVDIEEIREILRRKRESKYNAVASKKPVHAHAIDANLMPLKYQFA
jgi:hypothetical protein